MKNLFLSVVLLLTVSITFASNDVEKVSTFDVEKTISSIENLNSIDDTGFSWNLDSIDKLLGTCTITITRYNQDGEVIDTHTFVVSANSASHCRAIARVLTMNM
jgi:hypothetical protein